MSAKSVKIKVSRPAHVYSIISISLVLFILGILGVILLHARSLTTYFKENLEITIVLKDNVSEGELELFKRRLDGRPFTKQLYFVSKEDAAKRYAEENKEDFTDVLGFNPLFSSYNLYLKETYANSDSLSVITEQLRSNSIVSDVYYQEVLLDLIHKNINRISAFMLVLSIIFTLVAFVLIDNTIRMSMYTNRFLIKSMQLVGATRTFISRPFTRQSLYNGLVSVLICLVLLVITLIIARINIPELVLIYDGPRFILLCIGIFALGMGISWWSTRIAVLKYLKSPIDELY